LGGPGILPVKAGGECDVRHSLGKDMTPRCGEAAAALASLFERRLRDAPEARG
jgi:hypothetical protein